MATPEEDYPHDTDKAWGIDFPEAKKTQFNKLMQSLEANKEGLIHLLAEFDARTDVVRETIEFAAKNYQNSNEYNPELAAQTADASEAWNSLVAAYAEICERDNSHEEFVGSIATLYVFDNWQREALYKSLCPGVRLDGVDHEYTEASIRGAMYGTGEKIELSSAVDEAGIMYRDAIMDDNQRMVTALNARKRL